MKEEKQGGYRIFRSSWSDRVAEFSFNITDTSYHPFSVPHRTRPFFSLIQFQAVIQKSVVWFLFLPFDLVQFWSCNFSFFFCWIICCCCCSRWGEEHLFPIAGCGACFFTFWEFFDWLWKEGFVGCYGDLWGCGGMCFGLRRGAWLLGFVVGIMGYLNSVLSSSGGQLEDSPVSGGGLRWFKIFLLVFVCVWFCVVRV